MLFEFADRATTSAGLIDLRHFLEEASEDAAVYCCGPEALLAAVAGDIDHRDFVLSQDEKDSNDVMMVCVSRSRGSRIVLAP